MVGPGGAMIPIVEGLDRPTSLEIVGDTAYVVGLGGDVVRVTGIGRSPHHH